MAGNKQKQLIHILKGQLIKQGELDEAGYRGLLRRNYEAESSKDLTYDQASQFIDDLKALGGVIVPRQPREEKQRGPYNWKWKKGQKKPEEITKMPNADQIALIEHLIFDIHWRLRDGFVRWLQKYLNRNLEEGKHWRVLIHTSKEAGYVIEAMKSMKARQKTEASIKAQAGQQFYDRPASGGGSYEW